MADITYDIDALKTAKKAIDDLKDTLNTNNTELKSSLDTLKAEWKTDAGKKFFKDHQDNWSSYVDKYVKKLQGVSDMLQEAIDQYENIGNEVNNLKV